MFIHLKQFKFLLLFTILPFMACNTGNQNNKNISLDDSSNTDQVDVTIKKAKKVFYSMPSPLETAMLFKEAGASYDKGLMNPLENIKNYTNNRSMALNFGIYSADLSYASLFDQSQTSIKYMEATKKLADGLGIMQAIDKSLLNRLESNINNKAVVMDIIAQVFMNSNNMLKQDDRAAIATVILVGGWTEGLYIATQLSKKSKKENDLTNRIIDQRISLSLIINMLESYKQESDDIKPLISDMKQLKELFDRIKVKKNPVVPETDSNTNVTILKSKSEISMKPEDFKLIIDTVEKIRNNYTK